MRHAVEVGDDEALLALGVLAERNGAGDLRKQAGILRRARLEQLRHARQTAGDVARLRGFLRHPREHVADVDRLAVLHVDDGMDLERVGDRRLAAGELHFVTGLVEQLDLRPQTLGGGHAAPLRVDHDQRRQAGDVVDLLRDRHALLHVLELDGAGILGDDRAGVRIPARQHLPGLHRGGILHEQGRTVGHLVALALAPVLVLDRHLSAARDHHLLAARVGDVAHGGRECDHAVRLAVHLARHRGTRGGTADVERAHGELGARLADRLRGDHADRLAHVDERTAAEIAPVALGAQAVAGIARQRRAHADLVDAERFDAFHRVLRRAGWQPRSGSRPIRG